MAVVVRLRDMSERASDFDVLVMGSGPGGQKAAIAAAKLGARVALIERRNMIGGVCINTGTIPSKTLREAVLYLTGMSQRELYGQSYRVKEDITIGDLTARTSHVVGREVDVIRSQLSRNGVTILPGLGRFADPHTIQVSDGERAGALGVRGQDRDRHRHHAGPSVHCGLRRRRRSSTPTGSSAWSGSPGR